MFSFFKKKKTSEVKKNAGSEKNYGNCSECNILITKNNLSPQMHLCESCFEKLRVYSGKCSDTADWKYEDGVLTVYGNGAVFAFKNYIDEARRDIYDPHNLGFAYDYPLFFESEMPEKTSKIIFKDGISLIKPNGSSDIPFFYNLDSIVLPPSVKVIDEKFTASALAHREEGCSVFTVYGEQGTYAEKYAKENALAFETIVFN